MNCKFVVGNLEFEGNLLSELPRRKIQGRFQSGEIRLVTSFSTEGLTYLNNVASSLNASVTLQFSVDGVRTYKDVGTVNVESTNFRQIHLTLVPMHCWYLSPED